MSLVILSVVRLLAVGPEEGVGNVHIEMQRVFSLAELKEEQAVGHTSMVDPFHSFSPASTQDRPSRSTACSCSLPSPVRRSSCSPDRESRDS